MMDVLVNIITYISNSRVSLRMYESGLHATVDLEWKVIGDGLYERAVFIGG